MFLNRVTKHYRFVVVMLSQFFLFSVATGSSAVLAAKENGAPSLGHWNVGFFEDVVSTKQSLTMAGYGTYLYPNVPRLSHEGVHDPLKASAVAFSANNQDVIVVAVDSVGISGSSVNRIREKVRSRLGDNVSMIVSASHTHHAPDTLGLWGPLPFHGRDPVYMSFLEHKLAEVAIRAHINREAVTLRLARGVFENDSSAKSDPKDREDGFFVVAAYNDKGTLVGTLMQWAAHPTVIGPQNNALSADFIGAYRRVMETRLGGVHVYVNGAIGAVYHDRAAINSSELIPDLFPEGSQDADVAKEYREASTAGNSLAQRVLRVLPKAKDISEAEFSHCAVAFEVSVTNAKFIAAARAGIIESNLHRGKVLADAGVLRLGDVRFVTLPFEVFPAVANEIRVAASGSRDNIGFIGLANSWLGYLLTAEQFDASDLSYWRGLSPSSQAEGEVRSAVESAMSRNGCPKL